MKRNVLTLALAILASTLLHAQDNCCTAVPLFGPVPPPSSGGTGGPVNTDEFPCGCIEGETESTWFWFSAANNGKLEMLIKADMQDADYDFALYEGGCPCSMTTPFPDIACNADVSGTSAPFDFTGISSDPLDTWGIDQPDGFAPSVQLTANTNYYLFIDNVSGNGVGFTLEFAGDAVLAPPILAPGPEVIGPDTICPGTSPTFTAFIFGGVQYNAWWIANLTDTLYTSNPITLDMPETPGTYFVCAKSFTTCQATATTCIPVTVAEIPPTYTEDVICSGYPYFDENGTAYFSPGTYTINYETLAGCDSTVILTLTSAPSEIIILNELNCEGDCAEFNGETICESGTYQEIYTNQFGCDSTVIFNFVAIPTESIIEGADTLTCFKTSIVLDGSMSLGGEDLTYIWLSGDDTLSTDPTLMVTEGGTYTLVTNSMVDGDLCSTEESVEIIADNEDPENVTASGGALSCDDTSVNLMASSSTPGVSYEWTGPGFQSFEQNPFVNIPGNYQVTITGLNGCTTTETVEVTGSTEQPEAYASDAVITCDNPTVFLDGSSNIAPATYYWLSQFGDEYFEQNPEVSIIGKYTLTVTGPNGCTASVTINVSADNSPPNASAGDPSGLNCSINQIVLNGSGSDAGSNFSYLWTTGDGNIVSGETTLTPTVNQAGTYTILVTNGGNGCTNTNSVTITESPPVSTSISNSSDVLCFGTDTGSATVSASGGDESYIYQWSNSDNTPTTQNLVAGNYTVTVTDGDGCTSTSSVTIGQPDLLEATISATGQTGVGLSNGTATIAPTGGTPTYTYEWSNGGDTPTISGLAPGNYSVTVTDANGCTTEQIVTVSEFDCIVKANINSDNVSCNGFEDGTATVELESAQAPFTFIWSNDEETATIENLPAGTYTVTASDANGCVVVSSVTILEPAVLGANATATGETSAGANDGMATADPTGGTPSYSFLWNNGEETQTITNLAPGNYNVTVTDDQGCENVQEVTVFGFGCQIFPTITSVDVSCNGLGNGEATVTLLGGTAPFEYLWSNDETTATITDLEPGDYSVTVLDDGGCDVEAFVTILAAPAISIEILQQTDAGCGEDNGTASVEASGGTGDLSYQWSSGGSGSAETDLAAGTYEVSVTDDNDCEMSIQVVIESEDQLPPVAVSIDLTAELGSTGQVTIFAEDVDDGSFDDCGIAEMFIEPSEFDCSDLGENNVILTVIDFGGNSTQSTAVVTVIDNLPPTMEVQDITLPLDPTGNAVLVPSMVLLGSFDNCGEMTFSLDIENFDCDNIGENVVNLTATDISGNQTTEEVTITVVDEISPTIVCPDDLNLSYCESVVNYQVFFGDNCSDGVEPTLVEGLPSGSEFPEGENVVTYELTDESGNVATCSFTVSVSEGFTDEVESVDVSCFGGNDGSISILLSGGVPPYNFEWSHTTENTPTVSDLPSGFYDVIITDSSSCPGVGITFFIEEPSEISPILEEIVNETGTQMNGSVDVTIEGGTPPYTYVWTNEDGDIVSTDEDATNLSAGDYVLVVTDANGCVTESVYTVEMASSAGEANLENLIQIYPNPTSGEVTLELSGLPSASVEVTLSDLIGHTFETRTFSGNGKYLLDISANPQGVYLVKIVLEDVVISRRLVLNKP